MSESIHGHKVMEMMATAGKTYTKQALQAEIAAQFGEDARFHTCNDSELTAEALINFLSEKGKLLETEEGVSMPKGNLC